MRGRNPLRRGVGIAVGTIVILGVGLYGPVTLAGPLPAAHATITTPAEATTTSEPTLPTVGASAISTAAGKPAVATAGASTPVPLAGITKIVTALVVLDKKPVSVGRTGPLITMTKADAALYASHVAAGDVALVVVAGESWTERQMLEAMILGSSNNHADSLARWAFGSEQGFLDAAKVWLAKEGLTHTHLADDSGLDEASVATAADAVRIAALAMAEPTIADILANPVTLLANARVVDNNTVFHPELGVTGISRSYTDAAGVCLLFSATVTADGRPFTFYGAFIRMPDWDTLTADITTLVKDAAKSVHTITIVKKGDRFATVSTPWGQKAHAVADDGVTTVGWAAARSGYHVSMSRIVTASEGDTVGELEVDTAGSTQEVALTLDRPLSDPGPGWRVLNPVPVISAFVASLQKGR